jgi:hypothetical protein
MLGCQSQSERHIATNGQSVSKSWCRAPSGAHDQIFITIWQLRYCFFVGRPLRQEEGSVFCICGWSLPAQSFSGPSPLGFATIFYCLRFQTPFRRLLRLAGSRWRSVAYQWTSFSCTRTLRGNVFTESLLSNGYTRHNTYKTTCRQVQIL